MAQPIPHFAKCNDYWLYKATEYRSIPGRKLIQMLAERGYDASDRGLDKATLERLLQRSDRGFPVYVGHCKKELISLVQDRRLHIETPDLNLKRVRAERLVGLLEQSDERFHRFVDLPPELRNLVYQHYFAEFKNTPLHAPKQPPLTLACRLIREEALPIFYSSCIFTLNLIWRAIDHPKLKMPWETALWAYATQPRNMERIRRLHLRVWRCKGYLTGAVDIDLTQSIEERIKIRSDLWVGRTVAVKWAVRLGKEGLWEHCLPDPENEEGKLKKENLFALRAALERG